MAYDPTVWTDDETPVDADNMNHLEGGVRDAAATADAALPAPTVKVDKGPVYWDQASSSWKSALLDDTSFAAGQIFDPAQIKQSGAQSGQAVVWDGTKFGPANVAPSKLAQEGATNGQVVTWDGTKYAPLSRRLDFKPLTVSPAAVSATTEATAPTIITGNPITMDGSPVMVDFFLPQLAAGGVITATFVLVRDPAGTAVTIGYVKTSLSGSNAGPPYGAIEDDTVSAGSHTYALKVFVSASTLTISVGSGGSALGPGWLRVSRV